MKREDSEFPRLPLRLRKPTTAEAGEARGAAGGDEYWDSPGTAARLAGNPFQRGIIILPSAFTLGNLFFGFWAIVAANRGDFEWSAWFIVIAGILDMLDGRVARLTRTGTAFGAELDSLVDAISFGIAPAMIMYHLYFAEGAWSWVVCFVYLMAVVVRLARFNVEQAGQAKSHFNGLPSPTAGLILATYYPFTQTPFYVVHLANWAWPQMLGVMMVLLAVLMVSHVPYSVVPRIGFRSWRGRLLTLFLVASIVAAVAVPRYFFFPLLVGYTIWGLFKSVLLGLLERLPERDPLADHGGDESDHEEEGVRPMDYGEIRPRPESTEDEPTTEEP